MFKRTLVETVVTLIVRLTGHASDRDLTLSWSQIARTVRIGRKAGVDSDSEQKARQALNLTNVSVSRAQAGRATHSERGIAMLEWRGWEWTLLRTR